MTALGLINRIVLVMIVIMTTIMVAILIATKVEELNEVKKYYISSILQITHIETSVHIIELQNLVLICNNLVT